MLQDKTHTLPLGRVDFQGNDLIGSNLGSFTTGNLNASRLPNYQRMDISAELKSTFFGYGDALWQFQIINVLNRKNVWFYQYNFDKNPITQTEVSLLPIVPSVTYTIKF